MRLTIVLETVVNIWRELRFLGNSLPCGGSVQDCAARMAVLAAGENEGFMFSQLVFKLTANPLVALARNTFFLAVVAFTVPALPSAWLPEARADDHFVKMTQQSCTRGKMLVYLSQSAAFVQSVSGDYCVICKAPDWKITVYSLKTKRYFEESRKGWMGSSHVNLMDLLATKLSNMTVISNSQQKLLNKNVSLLRMTQPIDTHLRNSKILHETEYGAYYICDDYHLPVPVADFLVWLYKLPPTAPARGIPLKFYYVNGSKSSFTRLNTLSIEPVNFDSKRLSAPSGFTRVDSESMVMMDKNNQGDLEELWGARTSKVRGGQ